MTDVYKKIYAAVAKIPRGKVATYGQIARVAGIPRHARQVGYALASTPDGAGLPWQRVVNAKGEISARAKPGEEGMQRLLLAREGVSFNKDGRIDLRRFQWEQSLGLRASRASGLARRLGL